MIRAIIFDFDGVIAESTAVKTEAFRQLFAEWPDHVEAIVALHEREAGRSRYWKFATIYADLLQQPLSEERSGELGQRFTELALQGVLDAPLVPGFAEFLQWNAGRLDLYVASGTPHEEMVEIVHRRGLAGHFREVHGSPRGKGEIARAILARHGYQPHEVLFVGDALADQQGAREAGVFFLGRCPAGAEPPWPAARCVADLRDLPAWVRQFDRAVPVSVALCTLNGSSRGYLREALATVEGQSVFPEEVLVVDDGSTDDTAAWVRREFPGVRVLSQANQGLAEARNTAIRSTSCAWLAFLDDDDRWEPTKLARQLASQAPASYTALQLLDGEGRAVGRRATAGTLGWPEILLGNQVTGPSSVLLARWLVERVGLFQSGLRGTEDYDYWIRCSRHTPLVALEEALVGYRVHAGQMSTGYGRMAEKALEVADEHARSGGAAFQSLVRRYNAYGVLVMGLAGRQGAWSVGWAWARRQAWDLSLLAVRAVGMSLRVWPSLQRRFRRWEVASLSRRLRRLEGRA